MKSPTPIDPALIIIPPELKEYHERRRQASATSKPVSEEQAMRQILEHSSNVRRNVYRSTQLTEDGALILLDFGEP